jgi:hypothetical protein
VVCIALFLCYTAEVYLVSDISVRAVGYERLFLCDTAYNIGTDIGILAAVVFQEVCCTFKCGNST